MGREEEVRKANNLVWLNHKSLHFHPVWFLGQHSVLNVLHLSEQALPQHIIRKVVLKAQKNGRSLRNLIFKGKKPEPLSPTLPFFPSPVCERQLNCRRSLLWLEQMFKLFAITKIDAFVFLLLGFTCQVQGGAVDPIIMPIMQQVWLE